METWFSYMHTKWERHTLTACVVCACACVGRSWEDEKAGLMAQIEALKRDLKKGRKGDEGIGADGSSGNVELDELRRELNDAREKEVGA